MWSASEALSGLVPNCSCGAAYDLRFYAPHSLPCAHTFCLTCLSKEKQIKKRRCPSCRKKYSSFILNLALAEVVERIRQRREWLEKRSLRCDECESRRSMTAMRRCVSCTRDMNKHMSAGLTLDCVICLECCVDRHNGHQLACVASTSSLTSSTVQPVASSTPQESPRYLTWRGFTNQAAQSRQAASVHARLHSLPAHYPARPRVPMSSSVVKEELVYEARSPLYYQISSSNGKDVSRKTSLAKRLSGLIRSVTGSQSSLIKPVYQAGPGSSQSSGVSSGVSSDDQKETSLYQRISLQLPSRPASCVAISEGCMGDVRYPQYVNMYRRRSD